ncbi:thymidylate synthase [Burkholderia pseudomallei]|uniref:thymidylate synthase n=1 Tax=Burkholderia pseudomallei TaxID=28450 RepID=UPI000CDE407F|nr:thymidylate synthase [Burkholderia pseudomallei]
MKQYLDLVRTILDTGTWQSNRTGIRTIGIPGAMLRFDLQQGFPAVTTKKLAFKSAIGELVGFLRATRSAADFRALGCKVWDANANENAQWLANPYRRGVDDLGDVYGVQWRRWPGYKVLDAHADAQIADATSRGFRAVARFDEDGAQKVLLHKAIDQLRDCLDTIVRDPSSRRILFHGWNPALAEGAALLTLVGRLTGYTPRWFTYFIGDAHIYENQLGMLKQQLEREPFDSPRLEIAERVPEYAKTGQYEPQWLERIEPSDFTLVGYRHHEPLSAPMAV